MRRIATVLAVVAAAVGGTAARASAQDTTIPSPVRVMDVEAVTATTVRRQPIAVARVTQDLRQPRNIRLSFHLIEADGFTEVDPAIADIVEELRRLFRFEGYRLLDSSLLTGVLASSSVLHPDPHSTSVVRQRLALGARGTFDLQAYIEPTATPDAARIHVELADASWGAIVLETSVNVRDGQTIVLGSGRPSGSPDSTGTDTALILVMAVDIEPYD
jgi:hypothetical protein